MEDKKIHVSIYLLIMKKIYISQISVKSSVGNPYFDFIFIKFSPKLFRHKYYLNEPMIFRFMFHFLNITTLILTNSQLYFTLRFQKKKKHKDRVKFKQQTDI